MRWREQHGEEGSSEFDGGSSTGARGPGDWRRRLRTRGQGGEVRNPRGKPRGFIRAADARSASVHLDLRARHDAPPPHVTGHVHAIPIPSRKSRIERFAFPRRIRTLYPPGKHKPRRPFLFSLAHLGPRSSTAGPTKEGSANDSESRAEALVRSALNQFPVNGMP